MAERSSGIWIGDVAAGLPFAGSIDDVRIYNRALTADEVKQLYKLGSTMLQP
jgi:hypothetical protein